MKELEYRGYRISIYSVVDPVSPREWGRLGTIKTSNDRYDFSDKEQDASLGEDCTLEDMEKKEEYIYLPISVFEHGWISLRTAGHNDRGVVGFIYARKDRVRKHFGVEKIDKRIIERAYIAFDVELILFNHYINGNVFGFNVIDKKGDIVSSTGGYYGDDHEKNGLLSEAKFIIDYICNKDQNNA